MKSECSRLMLLSQFFENLLIGRLRDVVKECESNMFLLNCRQFFNRAELARELAVYAERYLEISVYMSISLLS
jgi:hypothetical protein